VTRWLVARNTCPRDAGDLLSLAACFLSRGLARVRLLFPTAAGNFAGGSCYPEEQRGGPFCSQMGAPFDGRPVSVCLCARGVEMSQPGRARPLLSGPSLVASTSTLTESIARQRPGVGADVPRCVSQQLARRLGSRGPVFLTGEQTRTPAVARALLVSYGKPKAAEVTASAFRHRLRARHLGNTIGSRGVTVNVNGSAPRLPGSIRHKRPTVAPTPKQRRKNLANQCPPRVQRKRHHDATTPASDWLPLSFRVRILRAFFS